MDVMNKLTVLVHVLLVAVCANDFVLRSLCLLDLFLECDDPAITLLGGGSLEAVDLLTNLDGEADEVLLNDIGCFVLSSHVSHDRGHLLCNESYQ